MEFNIANDSPPPEGWAEIKAEILRNLDIEAEYEELGLRWVGPKGGNSKGVRVCHAIDREDTHPSACVFLKSGVYHDSGGAGMNLSFFDFALKYGKQRSTRWVDLIRYYGDRAGVETRKGLVVKSVGRVREAVYEYRDADRVLRYGVFRYRMQYGEKGFTTHPWRGDRGWGHGEGCMEGVEPLPYRLPKLLASPLDQTVFIVEGEKDANRLIAEGLVATTAHGGVGNFAKTWGTEAFCGHFVDRSVVVIPDNDVPGKIFAERVCAALSRYARSVKRVELPDLPAKGDASDWLDMGHTVQELQGLAQQAANWEPSPEREEVSQELPAEHPIVWASEVVVRPVRWLWPGRIPLGKQTTLAGPGGVGKTFLLCDLSARVSAGLEWPFGDGECAPVGNVLYISGEDDPDDTLVPRMQQQGADLSRIAFLSTNELTTFNLTNFRAAADRAIAAMEGCSLIVIDPPSSFLQGVDENSNAEVRGILTPMKEWASQNDAAIVFNAHVNKGSGKKIDVQMRVMGSVAWVNGPRFSHMVTLSEDNHDVKLFVPLKTNIAKMPSSLSFRIDESEPFASLQWIGEVDIDAGTALNGKEGDEEVNYGEKQRKIESWLIKKFVERAEWNANDIIDQLSKDLGLKADGTFKRAKSAVEIKSRRFNKGWIMYVPEDWCFGYLRN